MGRLMLLMLLSGCVTDTAASASQPKKSALQEKLDALPRCEAGADVGVLTPRATICTKKHCQDACCNQCSWSATLETKNGQPTPVEQAKVQALLGLPAGALDCEIAAWAQTLASRSLSLEAGCVVR